MLENKLQAYVDEAIQALQAPRMKSWQQHLRPNDDPKLVLNRFARLFSMAVESNQHQIVVPPHSRSTIRSQKPRRSASQKKGRPNNRHRSWRWWMRAISTNDCKIPISFFLLAKETIASAWATVCNGHAFSEKRLSDYCLVDLSLYQLCVPAFCAKACGRKDFPTHSVTR